jgi:hypothetical protein
LLVTGDNKEPANLHIDWSEDTVCGGAANSTGKGKATDEVDALGSFLDGGGSRHCDVDECARRGRFRVEWEKVW